jgi:hypothetical protein
MTSQRRNCFHGLVSWLLISKSLELKIKGNRDRPAARQHRIALLLILSYKKKEKMKTIVYIYES